MSRPPTPDAGEPGSRPVRVAIAHEWLVQYAGSERCVEQLLAEFPDARLLTTISHPPSMPEVFHRARPSILQRIPGARRRHGWLLPLMPLAWRMRRPIDDVDVVISSSHAASRAVRVRRGIPHISYTYTPMRYAWEFELEKERFPTWSLPVAGPLMAMFRRWDRRKAAGVAGIIAISEDIRARIGRCYGRDAKVIHPPVNTEFFTPGDEGSRGQHFLFAGRMVAYKRPDLVIEAFRELPHLTLRMVGTGPMLDELRRAAPPNVEFLGSISDELLREEYRSARAMIFCAHEDFGIVMVESLACGTPVIALRRGGAMDIVDHGRTGWLIADQTVKLLRTAVEVATETTLDSTELRASAERFSQAEFRRKMRAVVEEAAGIPTNAPAEVTVTSA